MKEKRKLESIAEQVIGDIRAAASGWVERPDADVADLLAGVSDMTFSGERPGESWQTRDVLAYCILTGNGLPAGRLPPSAQAQAFVRAFADFASVKVAELCVAATGVDPRIVADEDNEVSALLAANEAPPPDVVRAELWMREHWRTPGRHMAAKQLLGGYYRSAFQRLALIQSTLREERARNELQRASAGPTLGKDVKLPQVVVRGWEPDHFKTLRDGIVQGEMFAPDEVADLVHNAAGVLLDRSQFGNLSTGQVRALMAVFHIFTTEGDDETGEQFRAETLTIPAQTLYQAAGITNRSAKPRKELFEALDELASRQLHLAVVVNHPQYGPSVAGERVPIFHLRPYWFASEDGRKKGRENVASIAREWGRRGMRDDKPEWTGPLPDYYEIKLPELVRRIGGSLVMSAEVLDRLDKGSKAMRGPSCGFTPQDFRLWMEITQRTQRDQPSPDGLSLLSFVDREALLVDIHGAEKIDHARSRGKLRGYIESFEKSAAVLQAGGLAEWKPGHRNRRDGAPRDVFVPAPDLIGGLSKRAKAAVRKQDKAQLALLGSK